MTRRFYKDEQRALDVLAIILPVIRDRLTLPDRITFNHLEASAGAYFSRPDGRSYTVSQIDAVRHFADLLDKCVTRDLDHFIALLQNADALPPSIRPNMRNLAFRLRTILWHGWTLSHQSKRPNWGQWPSAEIIKLADHKIR